jgi:hypothetical protein
MCVVVARGTLLSPVRTKERWSAFLSDSDAVVVREDVSCASAARLVRYGCIVKQPGVSR